MKFSQFSFYIIDSFSKELFKGEQATVMQLDSWLSESMMQNIASENNLSEIAFLSKRMKEFMRYVGFHR